MRRVLELAILSSRVAAVVRRVGVDGQDVCYVPITMNVLKSEDSTTSAVVVRVEFPSHGYNERVRGEKQ